MRGKSGNVRSNMFIYKMAAKGETESRVLLASEGDEGRYNRANRALYHFVENAMPLTLCIGLSGFVFPIPTFVCTVIYFFGRLMYTTGYTNGGYGKHGPGFLVSSLASFALVGMVLIVAFKGMSSPTVETTAAVSNASQDLR
jgi:hypothetical protein